MAAKTLCIPNRHNPQQETWQLQQQQLWIKRNTQQLQWMLLYCIYVLPYDFLFNGHLNWENH